MTDDTTDSQPTPERSSQDTGPASGGRPELPTFDPATSARDPLSAWTVPATQAIPTTPLAPESEPLVPPGPSHRLRWDGRKTAVVAALAIVLTSAGAIAAAAAVPTGTTIGAESNGRSRGGFPGGFPGGGQPGQLPGGGTGSGNTAPQGGTPPRGQDPSGSSGSSGSSLLGQVAPDLLAELNQVNPTLATQLEQMLSNGRLDPSDLTQLQQLDPSQLGGLSLRGGAGRSTPGQGQQDEQGQQGSATETSLTTT
ncbi:MAG: hypothetical protein ABIS35_10310 [Terracoccus sp.]